MHIPARVAATAKCVEASPLEPGEASEVSLFGWFMQVWSSRTLESQLHRCLPSYRSHKLDGRQSRAVAVRKPARAPSASHSTHHQSYSAVR
jgi:hypothetical protein